MKKHILKLALLLALVMLVLKGCGFLLSRVSDQSARNAGRVETWSVMNGQVFADLRYGEYPNNTYDLYIPNGTVKNGLLLFIHGGSWMGGIKEQCEYACRRYAKLGYVTATMNYSFINDETRRVTLPGIDAEVQACLLHIQQELAQREIVVNNLAVGGYSAGAQIAMAYALRHAHDCPFPIRFVIDQVGPVDLADWFKVDEEKLNSIQTSLSDEASDATDARKELENLVFTCSERELTSERMNRDSIQALINTCSPVALIDSLSPPTILAYGEQDVIVKPAIYHSAEAALRSHNVPYTLIVFPHSGHGLDNDRDCAFQLQAAVKEYIARYFK